MKKYLTIIFVVFMTIFISCKKQTIKDKLMHYYRLINADKGLMIYEFDTNKSYGDKTNEKFYMGSMMRLPVLVTAHYLADKNRLNLNQAFAIGKPEIVYGPGIIKNLVDAGVKYFNINELLRFMMQNNDATAMDIVINVMGIENINKALEEMQIKGIKITADNNGIAKMIYGLKDDKYKYAKPGYIISEIQKKREQGFKLDLNASKKIFSQNNQATPNAIITLLKKLYRNELFNKEKTNQVLELLQTVRPDKLISFQMPAKTNTYTTGTFSKMQINDAGIVVDDKVKFAIVMFCNFYKDKLPITLRRFVYITKLAYDKLLEPQKVE
jgi:beta-lactamase class A